MLLVLTLGWSYPWQRIHLTKFEMNNTVFGDRMFQLDGKAAALYRQFIRAWGPFVVLAGVLMFVIFMIFGAETKNFAFNAMRSADGSDTQTTALTAIVLMILAPYFAALIAFAGYRAKEYGYFASSTKYEELRFSFNCNSWGLIWLVVGNYVITALTLGFGLPFVQVRKFRFFCDHIEVHGEADFDAIRQSTEERDKLGEGLADAFDIGDF